MQTPPLSPTASASSVSSLTQSAQAASETRKKLHLDFKPFFSEEQELYQSFTWRTAEMCSVQNTLNVPNARYPEIGINALTQVAPDLHANFLYKQRSPDTLAGTSPYAIAMEYPRTETLETIFHLLAKTCDDVRISCMVIATDENRLQNEDLFPRYFDSQWLEKNRGAFPGIKVTSTAQATSPEGDYQLHRLQAYAENGEQLFALPLIRAVYWPDKGIIDRPLLENIIRLTTDFNAQANSAAGTGKAIPLFHCTAGLGRTGVLAAAFRIMDPEDPSSLGEILSGMIRDRSEYMVPTEEQFIFLVSLAKEYGKPVGIESLE